MIPRSGRAPDGEAGSTVGMTATDYFHLRGRLDRVLADLAAIGEQRGSSHLYEKATELAKKVDEQRFVVAVLGEFKRGKSTFINALLGEELPPVGVVPLTSVVTAVIHGANPRVEVVYGDGTRSPIATEEVSRYVTERHSPGEVRRTIEYPWRQLLHIPAELRDVAVALSFYAAGNFAHTLLILRATDLLQTDRPIAGAASTAVLIYTLHNAANALSAYPAGAIADKIGRAPVVALGYVMVALAGAGFGLLSTPSPVASQPCSSSPGAPWVWSRPDQRR
ncbi:MAG: hypothetical protein GEU79_15315 [Acidimicrobiia bacterium]|nr:hypothetical protein [Acidimicrobiia bacterium]